MKIQQKLAAALAALMIIVNISPTYTVKADLPSQETGTAPAEYEEDASPSVGEISSLEPATDCEENDSLPAGETSSSAPSPDCEDDVFLPAGETSSSAPSPDCEDDVFLPVGEASPLTPSPASRDEDFIEATPQESSGTEEETAASPSDASPQEPSPASEEYNDIPVSDETPSFSACIGHDGQGYYVKGTFTTSVSELINIRLLYSLDGENYTACDLDLELLNHDEEDLGYIQNWFFLRPFMEPFKSYLSGAIDRFCLKLSFTGKNGIAYETQAVSIDRGDLQPLPDEMDLVATFDSSMSVTEWLPRPVRRYGRYQLTISADAAPEDVAAYLPDTLPIHICLSKTNVFFADSTIDCPVTWKPLSLPQLTPGESVTIPDAAEEITVPAGTVLNTPMGDFVLNEPMALNQENLGVRLVLNVVSKDANPSGTLMVQNSGLLMAFDLKPTGAAAIRAYSLSSDDTKWTELPDLLLLEAVNAQPSAANSSHALVISCDGEPYRSYREAEESGGSPTPFLVGLRIEGGVYDGRQLILPWPGTYQVPPLLPKLDGSGGNQGNAGNGSKGDGTEEGQRPYLSQDSPDSPHVSKGESETQPPKQYQTPSAKAPGQEPQPYRENDYIPDMPETAPQTVPAPPESPTASKPPQPQKPETQTAAGTDSWTPSPLMAETGVQAENSPSEAASAKSGLSSLPPLSNQGEPADSHGAAAPAPLIPVTTAAAYLAIRFRYRKRQKNCGYIPQASVSKKAP